ncbi:hypothetical protein ACFLVZ_02495, partial [Chloroflexota bacterium]
FDEVSDNFTRIAVTEGDGVTQLYVEVEKWDASGKEAWLWASSENWTFSSSANTTLFLYYDNNQSDNTAYVGTSNSSVAHHVWDDNFKAVYHMGDGANSSPIYDSTSNAYNGTKGAAGEPTEGTGKVGNMLNFDGGDEISISTDVSVADNDTYTIEALFRMPDVTDDGAIYGEGSTSDTDPLVMLYGNGVSQVNHNHRDDAGVARGGPPDSTTLRPNAAGDATQNTANPAVPNWKILMREQLIIIHLLFAQGRI